MSIGPHERASMEYDFIEEHIDKLPDDVAALVRLKLVDKYNHEKIGSIAFNELVPLCESNYEFLGELRAYMRSDHFERSVR